MSSCFSLESKSYFCSRFVCILGISTLSQLGRIGPVGKYKGVCLHPQITVLFPGALSGNGVYLKHSPGSSRIDSHECTEKTISIVGKRLKIVSKAAWSLCPHFGRKNTEEISHFSAAPAAAANSKSLLPTPPVRCGATH